MKKISFRSLGISIPAMIVCALLASGPSAIAQTADTQCSNQLISGNYGYAAEGVVIGLPGLPAEAQFRSVGMTHFDGKGSLSWLEETVINGVQVGAMWTVASGSYTVNPNCTGTAVVNTPNSPVPLNLAFVVVKGGKEVHSVQNTNAVSTVFTKVN